MICASLGLAGWQLSKYSIRFSGLWSSLEVKFKTPGGEYHPRHLPKLSHIPRHSELSHLRADIWAILLNNNILKHNLKCIHNCRGFIIFVISIPHYNVTQCTGMQVFMLQVYSMSIFLGTRFSEEKNYTCKKTFTVPYLFSIQTER